MGSFCYVLGSHVLIYIQLPAIFQGPRTNVLYTRFLRTRKKYSSKTDYDLFVISVIYILRNILFVYNSCLKSINLQQVYIYLLLCLYRTIAYKSFSLEIKYYFKFLTYIVLCIHFDNQVIIYIMTYIYICIYVFSTNVKYLLVLNMFLISIHGKILSLYYYARHFHIFQ